MSEAKRLYENHSRMSRQEIYDACLSLNEWRFFSYAQISQISGVSISTLRGQFHNKVAAGRFNPKSIDTLRQLRLNLNNKRPVSPVLVKAAVADGNSWRMVVRCTGLTLGQIKRALRDD
jgi:hypothetical protein